MILAEGNFGFHHGKTAVGVIRYGPDTVVAVIDSTRAGGNVWSILPGHDIPIVETLGEALAMTPRPDTLLIGIAPTGGRLPASWRAVILEAIRMDAEYITLPKGAERDGQLDMIIGNIRKAADIGVRTITYHWTVIPIRRNGRTPGRGGSNYAAFKLEEDWQSLPVTKSGRVTSDDYWERITHFLEKVIPVAKQCQVKMACHPYDPPGLPFGYQGADNWDSPSVFEALKRYETIVDSPYNGFQLCLGTTAEGLKNPNSEIVPIVEHLGRRGKIHQIHMRNIRGGLHNFEEVYPDEGVMDFLAIMRVLRDTQFAGAICPDHMPRHADDPDGLQAFAFGYGYITALIQAVNAEV